MEHVSTRLKQEDGVVGTEGGRSPTGVPTTPAAAPEGSPPTVPSPEVAEKPVRRRFTADYKHQILEEADRCSQPGELGQLLRREGLYSSLLCTWRRQRDEGMLAGLSPKRRGRKAKSEIGRGGRKDAVALENERLRRENEQLTHRLKQAETIIEVQKKVSEMLAVSPEEHCVPPSENGMSD